MDSCVQREFDRKDFGGDPIKPVGFECQVCDDSREERRREEESVETQVEDNIRTNALLRTSDSDDETFNSVGDSEETIKANPESNECKDSAKTVTKPTDSVTVSTVTVSNSVGDSANKTKTTSAVNTKIWRPSKPYAPKFSGYSAKWGEAVGLYDEKGKPKRVVDLSEVKNYIRLKQPPRQQFQFYFSLVDPRFPQIYKSFSDVKQRWRMRYNIFVDGLVKGKVNSTVHVGEIIIYFDVAKHLSQPFYTNCSFYANYRPLEQSVNNSLLTKMIVRLHDVLTSNLMLQLKFPINGDVFKNTNGLYSRFRSNESELMQALESVRRGSKTKFSPNSNNWLTIDKNKNRPSKNRSNAVADSRSDGRYSGGRRRRGEGRGRGGGGNGKDDRNFDLRDSLTNKRTDERSGRRFGDSNRRRDRPSIRPNDETNCGHSLRENTSDANSKRTNDKNQTKNLSKQQTIQKRNRENEDIGGKEFEIGSANQFRSGRSGGRQSRPKTRFH